MFTFHPGAILVLPLIALTLTVHGRDKLNDTLSSGATKAPVTRKTPSSITIATFSTISTTNKLSVNPFISGTIGNYYFENRYNYEARNSASLNIGRVIDKKIAGFTVTPILGILVGNFKGLNTEVQVYQDNCKWYFSLDDQYVINYNTAKRDFSYTWLVGRYKLSNFFRFGITAQLTKPVQGEALFDRGITTSLVYKNITFNIYAFNYETHRRNAFISLRYNIKCNNKAKKNLISRSLSKLLVK